MSGALLYFTVATLVALAATVASVKHFANEYGDAEDWDDPVFYAFGMFLGLIWPVTLAVAIPAVGVWLMVRWLRSRLP